MYKKITVVIPRPRKRKETDKMSIRKEYRLPNDVVEMIEQIKERHNLSSDTQAVIYTIRTQGRSMLAEEEKEEIADKVIDKMKKEYKPVFDRLRLATSFSERYGYILLDIANTFLFNTEEIKYLLPANGVTEHKIIAESQSNYKQMITEKKQMKDNENLKRG